MKTSTGKRPTRLPTSFKGLTAVMVPHAITDDVDYYNVVELMNRLAMVAHPTGEQEHYLKTLEAVVESHDREHADPLLDAAGSTPIARLRYLVESSGTTVTGLGRIIGSVPAASLILNGKRELSKEHIRKLAAHFKVRADYFL